MACLSSIDSFLSVTDYSATSVRTMKNSAGQIGFAPHNLILASEDFSDSNWEKTNTTVTSNAAAAPDGTITADLLTADGTTATHRARQQPSFLKTKYKTGVLVENNDAVAVSLLLTNSGQVQNYSVVVVDMSDGSVGETSTGTSATQISATSTPLLDNWFYIELEAETDGTYAFTDFAVQILNAASGNNFAATGTGYVSDAASGSAYIWGAHLYENGLAGMFDVPEDQRALASLTKYLPNKAVVTGPNLVSNGTFDSSTAGWTFDVSATDNSTAGYLTGLAGGGTNVVAYQSITTEALKHYKVTITTANSYSTAVYIGTSLGTINLGNTGFMTDKTGVAYITASGTSTYLTVVATSSGANASLDNITVEEVDRNPSAARFLPRRDSHEYIDGAWVKGLKVESEARTNLITYSEDLTDASWTKVDSTVSLSGTAPDGGSSYKLIPNTTATNGHLSVNAAVTTVAYTFSFYAKAAEESSVSFVTNMDGVFKANVFNLSTGIASSASGWTCVMEAVGSGWYRCSSTATAAAATTYGFQIGNNSAGWTGDGTSGIYIYGAQFEAGSTPSSLIPTYGATRTRTAETFTQKSDKIIWPNTTYVDGTELVDTANTAAAWTVYGTNTVADGSEGVDITYVDSGDGAYVYLREAGGLNVDLTDGNVYWLTFDAKLNTGTANLRIHDGASYVYSPDLTTSFQSFSFPVRQNVAGDVLINCQSMSAGEVITLRNISVKEINPRALAVVMHGYMTYADTESIEATFLRQQASSGNLIQWYLNTTDTGVTRTGEVVFDQQSNGTSDTTTADPEGYSPGINVPIKIASRHLDNAIQGAADGTTTTENTTPPGLPDLSATQAEWFYDFMGHATFIGVGQESSADRLDSTNGPSTLEIGTDSSWP